MTTSKSAFVTISKTLMVSLLPTLLLSSCGGSGTDVAEINGTGYTSGPVQGFGSVIVNGIRFDTNNAQFSIDGQTGSQDDLSVGQKVTIEGQINSDGTTGTARQVSFEAELAGPIASIDHADNRFVVLGQTVIITGSTVFENRPFANLAVDDRVSVSGEFDADGNLRAFAVELETSPASTVEVKGTISALDNANQRFQLGQLIVDFSTAILEPINHTLADGDFVDVDGSLNDAGELIATNVELEERNAFGSNDHNSQAEVTGFVEQILSSTQFIAAGVTIQHDANTLFEDGTAADLQANARIEAEGEVDANGVLLADEIEFENAKERDLAIRINGLVQSTGQQQLELLNIMLSSNSNTLISDGRDNQRPFAITDLQVGDYVELRAFADTNGTIVAGRIRREASDAQVLLQGRLGSADQASNMLVIEGLSVDTSMASFETGEDDQTITAAEFYAQATPGRLVKAIGLFDGNLINAETVSFETADDETDSDDDDDEDEDSDDDESEENE